MRAPRHFQALAVAGIAIAGCANTDVVERYCTYGSVSRAQLDGCVSHVTESEVRSYTTNAANYARGESTCYADAGPFCEGKRSSGNGFRFKEWKPEY